MPDSEGLFQPSLQRCTRLLGKDFGVGKWQDKLLKLMKVGEEGARTLSVSGRPATLKRCRAGMSKKKLTKLLARKAYGPWWALQFVRVVTAQFTS